MQFEYERRHSDSGQADQYKEQNERTNGRMKAMPRQLDEAKEESEVQVEVLMKKEVAKVDVEHNREEEEVVQKPEAEEGGLIEEKYEEMVIRPSIETQQGEMMSEKYKQQGPEIKVGKVVKVVPVKGDVCLIKLETKDERFCRVKKVKVSEDGLERSATFVYRAKRKDRVAVQRLVLLVPGEKVAAGEEEEASAEG